MPKKKNPETLIRETHVMVHRLCQRFDHLEPVLLEAPKAVEGLRSYLAEFRRDIRARVSEVVIALTKKPPQ